MHHEIRQLRPESLGAWTNKGNVMGNLKKISGTIQIQLLIK
jgi:hypothetical protein